MKRYCVLLAAIAPAAAFAQTDFGPLRYDYVAANLAVPELDEIGIEVDGSTAVTENLVVFGRYRDFEPDAGVEQQSMQIGVGYFWKIQPSLDLMASLSYADNDIDRRGLPLEKEEGLILGGHVRGWMTGRVELAGSVLLDNSKGSDTDTVVEFGLQYFRQANWSVGGRIRDDDDATTLFLGVRFYFGASRRPLVL
ncbi:MAG TPA: hypothetical protein VIV64_02275 [Gammaproteobacteria bacterium]|jgi:hypothetical protein